MKGNLHDHAIALKPKRILTGIVFKSSKYGSLLIENVSKKRTTVRSEPTQIGNIITVA